MYVVLAQRQKTLTKSNIFNDITSIWTSIMKELLNINSNQRTLSLLTIKIEQLDEFGFIPMTAEEKAERKRWFSRMYYSKGGATASIYNQCKDLCKYLPHSKRGTNIKASMNGIYWCKECECLMKCTRCRCCGNKGRTKSRYRDRSRDNVKRID